MTERRSEGGVTLVSRWEGFPAMFLRIREVSLSRYECFINREWREKRGRESKSW